MRHEGLPPRVSPSPRWQPPQGGGGDTLHGRAPRRRPARTIAADTAAMSSGGAGGGGRQRPTASTRRRDGELPGPRSPSPSPGPSRRRRRRRSDNGSALPDGDRPRPAGPGTGASGAGFGLGRSFRSSFGRAWLSLPEFVGGGGAVAAEALARVSSPSVNAPGYWDLFLSYTQRDAQAAAIAVEIFFAMKERGLTCWLDVKMGKCDVKAMEEGVRNSRCLIAIITDNGINPYVSRAMCREEIHWALDAGNPIVPVVAAVDKQRIGELIVAADSAITTSRGRSARGRYRAFSFKDHNVVHLDRSGPKYLDASIGTILQQVPGSAATPVAATAAKVVKVVKVVLGGLLSASLVIAVAAVLYMVDPAIASRDNLDSRKLVEHMHALCSAPNLFCTVTPLFEIAAACTPTAEDSAKEKVRAALDAPGADLNKGLEFLCGLGMSVTPLHVAASRGCKELSMMMQQKLVDDGRAVYESLTIFGVPGSPWALLTETPAHAAAIHDKPGAWKQLLWKGRCHDGARIGPFRISPAGAASRAGRPNATLDVEPNATDKQFLALDKQFRREKGCSAERKGDFAVITDADDCEAAKAALMPDYFSGVVLDGFGSEWANGCFFNGDTVYFHNVGDPKAHSSPDSYTANGGWGLPSHEALCMRKRACADEPSDWLWQPLSRALCFGGWLSMAALLLGNFRVAATAGNATTFGLAVLMGANWRLDRLFLQLLLLAVALFAPLQLWQF